MARSERTENRATQTNPLAAINRQHWECLNQRCSVECNWCIEFFLRSVEHLRNFVASLLNLLHRVGEQLLDCFLASAALLHRRNACVHLRQHRAANKRA
jgi:hypothetical protein